MLDNWVNKNLTSVISSTKTLIHVFIVILFFESYFLTTEKVSLLNLSISFKEVKLAPFIFFFLWIAIFKVIWLVFNIARVVISKFTTDHPISSHNSFITFTLAILIGYYLYVSDDYLAQYEEQYFIYTSLFRTFCGLIMATCLFIYILFSPESLLGDSSDEKQ